jgi:hypothetical protein
METANTENKKIEVVRMVKKIASIGKRDDGNMGDYTTPKDYAYIREVKHMPEPNTNQLRIYCDSISAKSFNIQIRTHAPITDLGKKGSVPRNMIAGITVTVSEMEEVISYMKAVLAQYQPKEAQAPAQTAPAFSFNEEETNLICHALAQTYINHAEPAKEKAAWKLTKKLRGV